MSIIEQILNADKAPTSGELLKASIDGVSFSGKGFEGGTCFDHKVLLTAQIREADNGDLNVIIGDDQYLTFPDHMGKDPYTPGKPNAMKLQLNDRIAFDANPPQGIFRVSAGCMLTVFFNQESAGSVGLLRGVNAEDNPNQGIVNAGKISYMNGSMTVEHGTILLPSKLAVTELDEELIVYKKNFGALSLGGAAGAAHNRDKIERISQVTGCSFETGYAVQEIVPVTCTTDRQVNVYLYDTLVDQFKACAVYDKNGGPLELARRFAVHLGAKQDYSFYSGEPVDELTQQRVVFVTPENFESLGEKHGYSKQMKQALKIA
jgi:hypothetical protein